MKTNVAVMKCLAAVAIVACTVWTVTDAEKVSPCCVSVSRSRVVDPIIGYRLQKRSLPCIKAVILETERGHFCIDPSQPWVRTVIEDFKKSKKTTASPNTASPTTASPTTASPTSVSPRLRTSAPQSSTASS